MGNEATTFRLWLQDGEISPTRLKAQQRAKARVQKQKQKLVAHSTAMESIQAQVEPIDEQDHLP